MKTNFAVGAKTLVLSIAAIAVFTLSQGVARADEVTISGSTSGTVIGVTPLQFTGNPFFTGTTALGVGSLSGINNLGSFFLNAADLQPLTGSFTLHITFTVPSNIDGSQSTTFPATVVGSVSPNINQGGVNIHFTTPPQTFTFNNGTNSGSFSLTVADLFVQTGRSADITAGITGAQTTIPEPATLLLMGTGLTGAAAKLRKRKKAREDRTK
jgi:PEP-CTERM motif-containing protein